jgi:hypothetical protein
MPRARSSGNIAVSRDHSPRVRSVGPARNAASPMYGVTLAWMKSRTSIRSCQRAPAKACHGSAGMPPVSVWIGSMVVLTVSSSPHLTHDARQSFCSSFKLIASTG